MWHCGSFCFYFFPWFSLEFRIILFPFIQTNFILQSSFARLPLLIVCLRYWTIFYLVNHLNDDVSFSPENAHRPPSQSPIKNYKDNFVQCARQVVAQKVLKNKQSETNVNLVAIGTHLRAMQWLLRQKSFFYTREARKCWIPVTRWGAILIEIPFYRSHPMAVVRWLFSMLSVFAMAHLLVILWPSLNVSFSVGSRLIYRFKLKYHPEESQKRKNEHLSHIKVNLSFIASLIIFCHPFSYVEDLNSSELFLHSFGFNELTSSFKTTIGSNLECFFFV